jgi:serine protease Do
MRDLPRLVAETAVGKSVVLKVVREGREQLFSVVLGRLQDDETVRKVGSSNPRLVPAAPGKAGAPTLGQVLGFEIAPIDAAKRKTYGLADAIDGLVITSVRDGSDAYQKGFLAGFVVTQVNQRKVATIADVQAIVDVAQKAGRPAVVFKIVDPTGVGRFIAVRFAG